MFMQGYAIIGLIHDFAFLAEVVVKTSFSVQAYIVVPVVFVVAVVVVVVIVAVIVLVVVFIVVVVL